MKKIPVTVMLFSILVFIAMHSCQEPPPAKGNPDEVVFIYLKAINQNGQYHLEMRDSKGAKAIDDLTTEFVKEAGKSGKIIWKKDNQSGIKKLESITPKSGPSIIFEDGVHKRLLGGMKLNLLEDLSAGPAGQIIEYYTIIFVPSHSNEPVTIDPAIEIRPPSTDSTALSLWY